MVISRSGWVSIFKDIVGEQCFRSIQLLACILEVVWNKSRSQHVVSLLKIDQPLVEDDLIVKYCGVTSRQGGR
jgi:hypothetical protein